MNRRVLLVRLDNAGDVLLTGPAVRAVAASGATVQYLCGPRGAAAAALLPGVATCETVAHTPWIDPRPAPLDAAYVDEVVRRLADLSPDEAVVFTSFHQSALPLAVLLRMAGVPTIAAISEDYPGALLDVRHHVPDDLHEVERGLSLVATLGYRLPDGDDGRLQVSVPEAAVDDRVARLAADGGYVVVHPGASVTARAWAPWRAASLVDLLVRRGRHVVVTGTPAERALCAYVAGTTRAHGASGTTARGTNRDAASGAAQGTAVDLGGRTDLAGLAHVLGGARVVVTGNTGPAHLAAAVGTPVVSVYAPTVPATRWAPWRVPHVLLGEQSIPCAGCRATTCPVPGHPCIDRVEPGEVAAAVDALWGLAVHAGADVGADAGARAPEQAGRLP